MDTVPPLGFPFRQQCGGRGTEGQVERGQRWTEGLVRPPRGEAGRVQERRVAAVTKGWTSV